MTKPANSEIKIVRDLSSACIPFLLNAYKYGLFDLGDTVNSTSFLNKLQNQNYAILHKDKYSGKEVTVLQLTQKGASFVENNFLELLTDLSPYYIFPVLRTGDRVFLSTDVKNGVDDKTGRIIRRIITSPSGSNELDKGIYTVQACDTSSVSITDDCFILYRLRLSEFRESLRLYAADLKSESEELKTRFGTIRIRILVERLQDKLHTIRLAELIDELYTMPHTKDRIING